MSRMSHPRRALDFLAQQFPVIAQRLPLAKGAREQLCSGVTGLPYAETDAAFDLLTNSPEYLRGFLARDAWRHDPITGERVERITIEERAVARETLIITELEMIDEKLDAVMAAIENSRCRADWPE